MQKLWFVIRAIEEALASDRSVVRHLVSTALPPLVPALDAIIARFGPDVVAEITGRTRRLVSLPDGGQRLEFPTPINSRADANAFMACAKRILVFSDAGGTGRSYHASARPAMLAWP